MKKKIFLPIMGVLFLFANAHAQMTTFRFTYDIGLFDISGGMVQNPAGEFVTAGLNNSLGPYYGNAYKIDASGNVVWAKAYNAGFATAFMDIKNVSTGGYIMTGQSTSGGGGAILVRIDNNGNVIWAYRYQLPNIGSGNASNEYGSAVIETSDGGFLVGGGVDYFWDGISATTVDTTSALGFKVDATGALLWSRVWTFTTANPDEHYFNDVAESADGYFFVGQSSEGSGTLSSNGDYPSNALIVKTNTTGTTTYIRRWGVGNTTSQGINSALRLSTGNILLGGFDDLNAFIVSVAGTGGTPTVIFNRRLNGSIFGNTYLLQDIMENSDGNYSLIGTQLAFLSVTLNTMIGKINSSSGAWMWGRTYTPIGLSAILPEGGLCSDQGYYVTMTDQQAGGFNYNVIRTNTVGQTNDPASGCPGTAITPALGTETVTYTTPTTNQFNNMLVGSTFSPTVVNQAPVRTQHCFNAPSPLSVASTSQTNVTCFGACNGTATVTASGGTSPYTYSWAPSGGTAATASGLCPGTYTCTITDAALATTTASFTITQPTALSMTINTQTNVSCNGGATGAASVNAASGGTGPYTYNWTPGNPTGDGTTSVTGLTAGSWTCTVTDANGCTTLQTFTITQPTALSATSSSTQTSCSSSTGTATASPSGGAGGYTYSWAPSGGTAATASSLAAGTYTCTVTDANGCTTQTTATVTTVNGPTASLASSGNVSCNGGSNGTASVTASGGTPGYTYLWSPSGGTGSSASGLTAGNYTCTVTDAAGCTTQQTVAITQPTALSATSTSTSAGCTINNGTATATPSGGTSGYTYSWAPSGGTGSTASSLGIGNYTCTITDANGCTTTTSVAVTTSASPTASLSATTNVSCNGGSNGTATVSASGGTPGYTYSWSPAGGTGATGTGLSNGSYTCTITDANGCTVAQTASITEPLAITATNSTTNATCGNPDGSATITPSGGTPAYTYSWSSGGTGATENNLLAGTYTCTVTDANSCSATFAVTVSNANGPTVSLQSSGNVDCFGNSTGTATVAASGNGPFTYAWSSGGSAATENNLVAGSYTCTVTDVNGCSSAQTVTITEPTQLVSTPTSTNATCGNNNGTADASVTGGTPGYTYLWSNSATSATLTGLAGGNYTVTVTDANGCTTTGTVTVTSSGAPAATLSASSNTTCFGATDGTASVNASAGSPPYTYAWSPSGGTASSASGLGAGTYTCTVTDSTGCTVTQTVTITQPTAVAGTTSSSPENCGNGDGMANVSGSGGTAGYTYLWSNSSTNDTISNMAAGSYTVTITDANGCTGTATVSVGSASTATANAGTTVTITAGDSTVLNGSGNGSFQWSPSSGLSCDTCANPTAAPTSTTTYTLTVTDANGCTATDTVTVIVDISCGDVWWPKAFSPNGDNMNEVFYIRGNCIKLMDLNIYNRWGEKVFHSDDPANGWDGTWRDKPCESAVFKFTLYYQLNDGTEQTTEGNITLVK